MSTVTLDRQDVIERITRLEPQLRSLGVMRLALFGSFVRNSPRLESDVDLLIQFRPMMKTFDNFFAACELLESSLGHRVELLTVESLSPHIGPRILQEAEDVFVAD